MLAIAVAPVLSSCSVKTLPPAPASDGRAGKAETDRKLEGQMGHAQRSGTFTMHLTQKGKKFSGPVAITIESVTTKGTIKGTIRKNKLTLVVTAKGSEPARGRLR